MAIDLPSTSDHEEPLSAGPPDCPCLPPPKFDVLPPPEPWLFWKRPDLSLQWQTCSLTTSNRTVPQPEPDLTSTNNNNNNNKSIIMITDDWDNDTLLTNLEYWTKFIVAAVIALCIIALIGTILFVYFHRRNQMKAKSRSQSKNQILSPSSSNSSALRTTDWAYNSMGTLKPVAHSENVVYNPPKDMYRSVEEPCYASRSVCSGIDTEAIGPTSPPHGVFPTDSRHRTHSAGSISAFYHTLLPASYHQSPCHNNNAMDCYQTTENPTYEEISLRSLDRRSRSPNVPLDHSTKSCACPTKPYYSRSGSCQRKRSSAHEPSPSVGQQIYGTNGSHFTGSGPRTPWQYHALTLPKSVHAGTGGSNRCDQKQRPLRLVQYESEIV